jgi:hypothetical protein
MGAIVPISSDIGLRGRVLGVGWELPDDLSEPEWRAAGELLGRVERSVSWCIGDWWVFRSGKALVKSDGWEGAKYGTIRNAAVVCRSVPMSRRRDILSFNHHAEVASLPPAEADALLDWCEEPLAARKPPRSTRELRAEVSRRRCALGARTRHSCRFESAARATPGSSTAAFRPPSLTSIALCAANMPRTPSARRSRRPRWWP